MLAIALLQPCSKTCMHLAAQAPLNAHQQKSKDLAISRGSQFDQCCTESFGFSKKVKVFFFFFSDGSRGNELAKCWGGWNMLECLVITRHVMESDCKHQEPYNLQGKNHWLASCSEQV